MAAPLSTLVVDAVVTGVEEKFCDGFAPPWISPPTSTNPPLLPLASRLLPVFRVTDWPVSVIAPPSPVAFCAPTEPDKVAAPLACATTLGPCSFPPTAISTAPSCAGAAVPPEIPPPPDKTMLPLPSLLADEAMTEPSTEINALASVFPLTAAIYALPVTLVFPARLISSPGAVLPCPAGTSKLTRSQFEPSGARLILNAFAAA